VFDSEQNTWRWENEYVTFVSANEDVIEIKTTLGSVENNLSLDVATGLETNRQFEQMTEKSLHATLVSTEDTYFKEIVDFVSKYTPLHPSHFCEYLETSNYIVVSYYVANEKLLDNYLLVTNPEGEELLHLCIAQGMKGIANGTFQVSNALLSFVKDKNELFIVEMS